MATVVDGVAYYHEEVERITVIEPEAAWGHSSGSTTEILHVDFRPAHVAAWLAVWVAWAAFVWWWCR